MKIYMACPITQGGHKSFAPRSRQITTSALQHSYFYRLDALCDAQLTVSMHWRRHRHTDHKNCKYFTSTISTAFSLCLAVITTSVSFAALTLMVRRQEGTMIHKNVPLIPNSSLIHLENGHWNRGDDGNGRCYCFFWKHVPVVSTHV